MLGTSLAAQEYWDNHRALDYLLTRKDIDPEHIGVYGSSGGGTQTAYYIGLDPRVKVAAICSFFSTRERTMELQGPSDEPSGETINQAVEGEKEDNPLSAVETITVESKV